MLEGGAHVTPVCAQASKGAELQQQLQGLSEAAGSVQHLHSQLQRAQSSVTALQACPAGLET